MWPNGPSPKTSRGEVLNILRDRTLYKKSGHSHTSPGSSQLPKWARDPNMKIL